MKPLTPHTPPRSRFAVAGLLAVLAMLAPGPSPATAAAVPDRATLARVDRVIHDGMDRSGIPGFAVAVIADGEVVHVRGFGDAGGGRPVTAQTPFVLGSTAKSFTALAAMQLVDAGRLDLDAPVRRYVPELRLADQAAADRITVRRALQQTSGLPETAGGPVTRSATDGSALDALRELRDTERAASPGAEFAYSNANFILAGLIIERASGQTYARYLQRHIFAPLGMRHSYVALDAAKQAGLATGHRYWFGFTAAHGPTFRSGIQSAGYLISSAEDMGRYLAMYLNDGASADGRRVVSRRALKTMLAAGHPGSLGPWADHADARYAMGWYVGGPWSEPALLHPGRAPDSSALIAVFPGRELAIVTLTNAANQLTVPGYPGSVDRVERNAVDALIGDPVNPGTSLHRFYFYFDLVALVLLAAATWPLIRATRTLRSRSRPRRPRRAIAGIATRAAAGLLLAALPALTVGWRAAFLWQPDLATFLVLLGAILLLTATLRLTVFLRRAPRAPQHAPASPAATDAASASARPSDSTPVMLTSDASPPIVRGTAGGHEPGEVATRLGSWRPRPQDGGRGGPPGGGRLFDPSETRSAAPSRCGPGQRPPAKPRPRHSRRHGLRGLERTSRAAPLLERPLHARRLSPPASRWAERACRTHEQPRGPRLGDGRFTERQRGSFVDEARRRAHVRRPPKSWRHRPHDGTRRSLAGEAATRHCV
jgi:CubicO group peptidase (beta-lactamase class C family)